LDSVCSGIKNSGPIKPDLSLVYLIIQRQYQLCWKPKRIKSWKIVRLEEYPLKKAYLWQINPQQLLSITRVDNKKVRG
jgi:hypothetical protein